MLATLWLNPDNVAIFIRIFNFRRTARLIPGKGTDAKRRTAAITGEAFARVDKWLPC